MIRNAVVKAQRKDKKIWANDKINKEGNKSKNLWKTVKSISGDDRKKAISCLKIDGVVNSKKMDIANGLNNNFINKVNKLKDEMPKPQKDLLAELKNTPTPMGEQLKLMSITQNQLTTIIHGTKKTAACGTDTISGSVLADLYPSIQRILLHLINVSLCQGVYPKCFKTAKLIPQVKPGKDPLDSNSYRPISNLCSIGKVLESAFFNQVNSFIEDQLNPNHHGGRPGHSTASCMVEINEGLQTAINNKLKVALLAVDMSAAYDLCHHPILLEKTRLMRLGNSQKWLKSFLSMRSQVVNLEGTESDTLLTGNNGVVQGGESSGQLFLIYLNDLPNQVNIKRTCKEKEKNEAKEFVDDVNLIIKAKNDQELKKQVEKEYEAIDNYLTNHRMVVNPSKTQLMVIKPPKKKPPMSITLKKYQITHQDEMKILGINLSSDMKMDNHIWKTKKSMIRAINIKTALLKTVKPYLDTKALGIVGGSLINSTILYGAPVWGHTTQKI